MNHVIILAGGVGSRFWPLSRQTEPKQFLNICSNRPMLEDALRRLAPLVERNRMHIATSAQHARQVRGCVKGLGIAPENILFEPSVKNTLAPIAFLSEMIRRNDPHAVIAVVPCDHFVCDDKGFRDALKKGMEVARQGAIVTFGFPPRRPETGYGYIKAGGRQPGEFRRIERFIEKPPLAKARAFMRSRNYYWNGGVFIFRADLMLEEIKKFLPQVYRLFMRMKDARSFKRLWRRLPSISIDYAVMEKTKKAVLLGVDYGWLDLGSWQAVIEVMEKDSAGNIFKGRCLDYGSRDSLVWAQKRLIATVGLENIIVVDTKDALLVCAADKTQDVKKIVDVLKKKNYKEII